MATMAHVKDREAGAGGMRPDFLSWCRLAEQPDHLVPARALPRAGPHDRPLSLSPHLAGPGTVPAELEGNELLATALAQAQDVVWVRRSPACTWNGYELTAPLAGALSRLRGGMPAIALPAATRLLFQCADILIDKREMQSQSQEWLEVLAEGARQYQERGYTVIANLIHPFQLSWLRRHYRRLVRMRQLPLGDGQSSRRYWAHNETIAAWFHQQLTPIVRAIARRPLKPSYVYSVSYCAAAELQEHTDREQCEVSISYCLDYSPEPDLHTPWPLRLHTSSGTTPILQAIGDGLVYAGARLPHSRMPLPRGHSSTSLLFHYVSEDFEGPLS